METIMIKGLGIGSLAGMACAALMSGAAVAKAVDVPAGHCTLFSENNFKGTTLDLAPDESGKRAYTLDQSDLVAHLDQRTSSVACAPLCTVTLFAGRNKLGRSLKIPAMSAKLDAYWNNRARSVEVSCAAAVLQPEPSTVQYICPDGHLLSMRFESEAQKLTVSGLTEQEEKLEVSGFSDGTEYKSSDKTGAEGMITIVIRGNEAEISRQALIDAFERWPCSELQE